MRAPASSRSSYCVRPWARKRAPHHHRAYIVVLAVNENGSHRWGSPESRAATTSRHRVHDVSPRGCRSRSATGCASRTIRSSRSRRSTTRRDCGKRASRRLFRTRSHHGAPEFLCAQFSRSKEGYRRIDSSRGSEFGVRVRWNLAYHPYSRIRDHLLSIVEARLGGEPGCRCSALSNDAEVHSPLRVEGTQYSR